MRKVRKTQRKRNKKPRRIKRTRSRRGGTFGDKSPKENLPDVSEELVNFETIDRKPNAYGGGVGSMFRRV